MACEISGIQAGGSRNSRQNIIQFISAARNVIIIQSCRVRSSLGLIRDRKFTVNILCVHDFQGTEDAAPTKLSLINVILLQNKILKY